MTSMEQIHNQLSDKYPWYSKWHRNPSYVLVHWLVFLLICAGLSSLVYSVGTREVSFGLSTSEAEGGPGANLKGLTKQLLKQADAYYKASDADKPNLLTQLKLTAKERKLAMKDAVKSDPASALSVAFDAGSADTMPDSVTQDLEETVTVTGDLDVIHGDNFDKNTEIDLYQLTTADGQILSLHPTKHEGDLRIGGPRKVQVKGVKVGSDIILGKDKDSVKALSNVLGAATGPKILKTAVIMYNFQDNTSAPTTADAARSAVFAASNSVTAFHSENSYGLYKMQGKARVDGDVFGVYTVPYTYNIPASYTGNPQYYCFDAFNKWHQAAYQAAVDAGNDMSGYDMIIYVFPEMGSCYYAGAAGGVGPGGALEIAIDGGYFLANGVTHHEIGHEMGYFINSNSGIAHSTYLLCGSVSVQSDLTNCSHSEYGDPYDVMGYAIYKHQMTSAHKDMEGALSESNKKTVDTSGTYTILPLETNTAGLQMIQIPRYKTGTGEILDYYTLDFRQAYGFDYDIPNQNGVSIHYYCIHSNNNNGFRGCPGAHQDYPQGLYPGYTYLIDATPTDGNYIDNALQVGKTFKDPYYGISVTTLSASPSGVTVKIDLANGPCVRANPTVSISPESQWGLPGQALSYNMSITNNDSFTCGTSTFSAANISLPTGFTLNPASSNISLAPTDSTTLTLSVVSASDAAPDLYTIAEAVSEASDPNYSAQTSANYNVQLAPPDLKVPSTPQNFAAAAPDYSRVKLSWKASTDNVGVAGYEIFRNGTSLTKTTDIIYYDTSVSPATAYSYYVKAYDAAGNYSLATATKTLTVPAVKAPTISNITVAQAAVGADIKISWKTSAATNSVVTFGTDPLNLAGSLATSGAAATVQSVIIPGTTFGSRIKVYYLIKSSLLPPYETYTASSGSKNFTTK